ncbi:MAG: ABC transporter ATP-binding protein [Myxococcales bacterium]
MNGVPTQVGKRPLLELRAVTKGYGGRGAAPVLRDLSLSVGEGEMVAVLGRSGAGKTTLLSLAAGLLAPDAGEVVFDGRQAAGPGPDRGVVFQNYSLLPWLTALENVLLAVEQLHPGWPRALQRDRALEMLEVVGLGAAREKRPRELSGGMRQRVSIARALALEPRMLLLDEPLGALDALTRAHLQTELARICRASGKTVLLITNDVDEALLLADRVVPLSAGPCAALGPSVEVSGGLPRDLRALAGEVRFRRARHELVDWLTGPGKRADRFTGPTAVPRRMEAP